MPYPPRLTAALPGMHVHANIPRSPSASMLTAFPTDRHGRWLAVALFITFAAASDAGPTDPVVAPDVPLLEVTANTTLEPGKTYGRIVVKASGITIDGKGAWVVGAAAGDPKTFTGVGIEADGISNVVLKNVNVRGFETGLQLQNARGWTVENCDLSNNFDDPSFGWGQMSRRGGIVLVNVSHSKVQSCRANRNWVGCVLERSDGNRIEACDLSRCSETCLKMWQATRNTIEKNKLDYGNRAKPDEVHARDSACVLIESGSDDNLFADNSITHGGDGIFVRSLNGWISTGNRFLRNDCSYAHNHGVECWCPGNIYEGNKANHCSYGFWLGGSDRTVLLNNEASHNGDPAGNHFSPHLPNKGHAGIVFMHGSGYHIVARGNRCVGNNGAGIALIGDLGSKGGKWKAHHWVLDGNKLTGNRWGLYAQHADWIDLGANTIRDNTAEDIHQDASVTHVTIHSPDPAVIRPPVVTLTGPEIVPVGQRVRFDAAKSTDPAGRALRFRWNLGDGTVVQSAAVEHAFAAPGFYRVGVTVTNGTLSALGSRDVYAVRGGAELGTEGSAGRWSWTDPQSKVSFADDTAMKLVGQSSMRADVEPYSGGRVELHYPLSQLEGANAAKVSNLSFWIRAENHNIPSWQGENPVVTIRGTGGATYRLRPKGEVLHLAEHPESRAGWLLVRVPLAGAANWLAEGQRPEIIEKLSFSFDSWGGRPFRIWLDGMMWD